MKRSLTWVGGISALALGGAAGCGSTDTSCRERLLPCDPNSPWWDASVREAWFDASGRDGTDGGLEDAGVPDVGDAGEEDVDAAVTCDGTKTPSEDVCVIANRFGVFVSPSGNDSSGNGTRESPFRTIGRALNAIEVSSTMPRRVYACDDGTGYAEAIAVDSTVGGVSLYGGFSCTGWTYSTSRKASVRPAAGADAGADGSIPLTIRSVTSGVTVEDFELEAPDATAPGGSSVAVFASESQNVVFRRVTMRAGRGMDGAPVAPGSNYSGDYAARGNNAVNGTGGAAKTCMCVDGTMSTGGRGGDGGGVDAGLGENGEPGQPDRGGGTAGLGGTDCGLGGSGIGGNPAPAAASGNGASTYGALTPAGWTPTDGTAGTNGPPGQGGGGGGGRFFAGTAGGGGGGGCGGCGGAGGPGGQGGGSSFTLLSYQSEVTLDTCTLVAGAAGNGSAGAPGQVAQGGGLGGVHVPPGCPGGAGGNGGNGGSGGGGAGGLSVAVAYVGPKPTRTGGTAQVAPQGGRGGDAGGDAGATVGRGQDGVAQQELELP